MDYTYEQIAKMIDHSLLNPTLTAAELEAGIQVAIAYDVASVCIMPYYLKRCADLLRAAGGSVKASTTIGFPHGVHTTAIKLAEAERALADGCEELDTVCNISKVLSCDWDYVRHDLKAVIDVAHAAGQKVKVIFENCYLQDMHKIVSGGDLRRSGRRLQEDEHRIRQRRRNRCGPPTDARSLPRVGAGQGRRRCAVARQAAGGPGAGGLGRRLAHRADP